MRSSCETIGRNEEMHWKCRVVPLCSKTVADQAGRFASKPSQCIAILRYFIKLAFLNALTITKDFTENPEFNKRHSRLVAALE